MFNKKNHKKTKIIDIHAFKYLAIQTKSLTLVERNEVERGWGVAEKPKPIPTLP